MTEPVESLMESFERRDRRARRVGYVLSAVSWTAYMGIYVYMAIHLQRAHDENTRLRSVCTISQEAK